jgi:RNA recognition motif-containing protein
MATRIYVGNLPYSIGNEQLAQVFSAYGDVVEAAVVMDRDSGQSKGFGFVEMSDDAAAQNAIASLNGTTLDNRTIRVSEAQPRTERSGRPRSGGGYGNRGSSYGGGSRDYDGRQDRYGRSRSRDY